jgi:hypothetical protein
MKTTFFSLIGCVLMGALCLLSCEKPVLDEETTGQTEQKLDDCNLVLRVSSFRQVPYTTRALVDITGYSERLNYVLYQNGNKVKSLDQSKTDSDYGQVAFRLTPGTYQVLVIAHSCSSNPTLAHPESIQFTNSTGYSDTFYYYGDIEVTNEAKTHDITLARASSLLRFIVNDNLPANVVRMHFLYTGGSGVLNAVTGYGGDVNSRQERLYRVDGLETPLTLPLYTFLQSDEATLDVTVTARDANNNTVVQRKFTGIPMKRNMITEYSGSFFEQENSFSFKAETDWGGIIEETY